ncbi:MAG: FAD-dependent oxidoreductase [Phycisphaerae bacterium]
MFARHEADVLVVGAGPVGLFAALQLAERGLRVQVVDEERRTGAHSYALMLHPDSLRLLDEIGLASAALETGYRVDRVALYDDKQPRAEYRFSDLPARFPFLTILRQDAFEALLEERLRARGVQVQWSHRVAVLEPESDHVNVTIDQLGKMPGGYAYAQSKWEVERTMHTRARYVVGADGHRSLVRRAFDSAYPEVGPTTSFAVFEFQTDAMLGPQVRLVLDAHSANALWPLPGGWVRFNFQVEPDDASTESRTKARLGVSVGPMQFPELTEQDLMVFLQARAPWFRGRIGEMRWSMRVRFEQRLAESFGSGRLWLAGDAAHMASPVGGHSMNVGLREAHDLASRIAQVLKSGAAGALLDEYSQQRAAEWRQLFAIANVAAADGCDPWVAENRARIAACIQASGAERDQLLTQLRLRRA